MINETAKLELMVIITGLNQAEKTIKAIQSSISYATVLGCRGTALKGTLHSLGLGNPKKDMILAFCKTESVDAIYKILNQTNDKAKLRNTAFTIPVGAAGGMVTLQILLGNAKNVF